MNRQRGLARLTGFAAHPLVGRANAVYLGVTALLIPMLVAAGCKTSSPKESDDAPAPGGSPGAKANGSQDTGEALIGAWSFEEEAGDQVRDHSGNGLHGIASNAQRVPGAVGRGLRFTGDNSGVDIDDGEAFHIRGSLTIEAWVKPEAYPPDIEGHNHGMILFRRDSRVGLDPYHLSFGNEGALRFGVLNTNDHEVILQHPIKIDEFSHVAGVLDVNRKKVGLYVNGELVSEAATDVTPLVELDPAAGPCVGIGHCRRIGWKSSWDYGFVGVIDEVKLHGRPLAAAEIRERAKTEKDVSRGRNPKR
jgi:hypothetical protein